MEPDGRALVRVDKDDVVVPKNGEDLERGNSVAACARIGSGLLRGDSCTACARISRGRFQISPNPILSRVVTEFRPHVFAPEIGTGKPLGSRARTSRDSLT